MHKEKVSFRKKMLFRQNGGYAYLLPTNSHLMTMEKWKSFLQSSL